MFSAKHAAGFSLLLITLGPVVSAGPPADKYIVTDLGVLPGGDSSEAVSINNRGEVVGSSQVGGVTVDLFTTAEGVVKGPARHAFLWKNGVMHNLGVLPGYDSSTATAINNKGSIVGQVYNIYSHGQADFSHSQLKPGCAALFEQGKITLLDPGDTPQAVSINDQRMIVLTVSTRTLLYKSGQTTDIGSFPRRPDAFAAFTNSTVGHAINGKGQIVGTGSISTGGNLLFQAFFWESGKITDLAPSMGQTEAFAVNDKSIVVGLEGALHACVWEKSQFRRLSSGWSRACAINNRGQIVGLSHEEQLKYRDGGSGHAVLWQNGQEYALNDLLLAGTGWILNEANAINDRGQIVGYGEHNGRTRAFLLTPQSQIK